MPRNGSEKGRAVRLHENRVAKLGVEYSSASARARQDPLVVSGAQLRELLQPLIDLRDRVYMDSAHSHVGHVKGGGSKGGMPLGGYAWLASQFGVDNSRVRLILNKTKWVNLSLVDRWLTALHMADALTDGSLTIVANPSWHPADWYTYYRNCGEEPPSDVDFIW